MDFSIIPIQGIRGFRLEGELDVATVNELTEALDGAIEAGGPILLDLSPLSFIDSMGIHAILQAIRTLEDRGWCVYLHTDNGEVARALELLGVGKAKNAHIADHPGARTPPVVPSS